MRLKLPPWIVAARIAGMLFVLGLTWFVFPKNRLSNSQSLITLAGLFSVSSSPNLTLKTYNANTPCPASTDMQIPNQGSGLCTGNLHFIVPLDNTALALIYNSNFNSDFMAPFAEDRGFGMGWQLSRDERVVPNGNNLMTLITGSGSVVTFKPNESNQWSADPRRTRSWLTLDTANATLYRNFPGGVNYSYQLFGNNYYLTAMNFPTGQTVTISRDKNTSFITGVSDSFGTKVSLTCGTSQCTSLQSYGGGGTYSFGYLNGAGLNSITSPDNYLTQFGYQAINGASKTYNLVSSMIDPLGKTTQFGYYTNGALATVVDPQNFSTQFVYSNRQQGNTVISTDTHGSRGETLDPTTFNILKLETPIGTTTYQYDAYGRITSMMPPNTNDAMGFTYDSNNPNNPFPIQTVDSYGLTTRISYSDYLYPLTVSVTGPSGKPMRTVYTYDNAFRVTSKMTDGIGYNFAYDNRGNVTTVSNQAGVVLSSNTFDSQGQLTETTDFFGVNQKFTYNKGDLATLQDEFGQVSSFSYNTLGQVTQANYSDGTSMVATYTPTGNPTGVTENNYGATVNTSLSISLNNSSATTTYNGKTLSSTNSSNNQFGEEANSTALLPNGVISAGFMDLLTGAASAATQTSVTTSSGGSCSRQPGAMKSAPTSFYNLNVSINGVQGGSGTVVSTDDVHKNEINCGSNCNAQYTSSQTLTLTATPALGSTFTGWSGGQCSGSKSTTCTVQLSNPGDTNITANFQGTVNSYYTLKVNITGSGAVVSTPSGINCGTATTNICQLQTSLAASLKATPASGYAFTGWTGCPGAVSGNTCSIPATTTGTVTVTANFSQSTTTTVKVTTTTTTTLRPSKTLKVVQSGATGTITTEPAVIPNCSTSTCSGTCDPGTQVTVTAIPPTNFKISNWSGCNRVTDQKDCVITVNNNPTTVTVNYIKSSTTTTTTTTIPNKTNCKYSGGNPWCVTNTQCACPQTPSTCSYKALITAGTCSTNNCNSTTCR